MDQIVKLLEEYPLYKSIELDKSELINFPIQLDQIGFNSYCENCKLETTHTLKNNGLPFRLLGEKDKNTGYLLDLINHSLFFEYDGNYFAPCGKCFNKYISISLKFYSDKPISENTHKIKVEKTGQFPPFNYKTNSRTLSILSKSSQEIYRKAINLYGNSYGIGCLVYLRRIVEDEILLILKKTLDPNQVEGLEKVELENLKDDKKKVYEYAGKLIPQTLKTIGNNPILRLWEMASNSIHSSSDQQAMEICADMIELLDFLIDRLEFERASAQNIKRIMKG